MGEEATPTRQQRHLKLLLSLARTLVEREVKKVARGVDYHTRPYTDWTEVAATQRVGRVGEGGGQEEVVEATEGDQEEIPGDGKVSNEEGDGEKVEEAATVEYVKEGGMTEEEDEKDKESTQENTSLEDDSMVDQSTVDIINSFVSTNSSPDTCLTPLRSTSSFDFDVEVEDAVVAPLVWRSGGRVGSGRKRKATFHGGLHTAVLEAMDRD